jgi:hypothetical protein
MNNEGNPLGIFCLSNRGKHGKYYFLFEIDDLRKEFSNKIFNKH